MKAIVIDSRGRRYPNTLAERTVLKAVTARARKMGAWIQGCRVDRLNEMQWEFYYIGDRFTWRGLASNAFDARLKGWEAWIVRAWLRSKTAPSPLPARAPSPCAPSPSLHPE